jgi:hypothetical protein
VGTIFGRHGINISSAAVGHTPDGGGPGRGAEDGGGADRAGAGGDAGEQPGGLRLAAMVVTTDVMVPAEVVKEIVDSEGFFGGWAVTLR